MSLRLAVLVLACTLGTGCAAEGLAKRTDGQPRNSSRAATCKTGDEAVPSASACLLDDAACYLLADGGWCTGPRGNVCPSGSTALPTGSACPSGAVCFRMGESLECLAG